MAVKGQISKEKIANKILETFEGSFRYDKEIRIPMIEDGVEVQIKVTLTAAKANVEREGGNDIFAAAPVKTVAGSTPTPVSAPSDEEKATVAALMKKMGLA